ncbi:hypothetical protein [Nocardiopsis sp. HUAS JQ3]|uniref:hypothetical protein n=1 Tax=Nocardiopsis sp. HUAS JQ3 TaxID=3061629 RepID=UPI0023A948B1|nr:hypothetical protein [Nocardiopsis sp. HUAS JQ3]WDZ88797.1 hypothetical protein PV789_17695 [Nocardiopsis sp. HUAS JQ3]
MLERLVLTQDECSVFFVEEKGRRSKVFDFAKLQVSVGIQQWLARSFARATGPTSGVKRIRAAESLWDSVRVLAGHLGKVRPPVHQPAHITAVHIKESLLAVPPGSKKAHVERLRVIFRADQELVVEARNAILHGRLPAYESKVQPYSRAEHQELMTAVRRDIRLARDRIQAGRELLAAYRRGDLGSPSRFNHVEKIGRVLDTLDRTGDVPRRVTPSSPRGGIPFWVQALGGVHDLVSRLTLTRKEMVAFCLMLVDLTGENRGTIGEWPAAHFRPDGDLGGPALALVDAVKPRRGPSLEFMVTPLEDVPVSLVDVLRAEDDDKYLFRSALRVYQLLLDLTELARRHSAETHAFCYPKVRARGGLAWGHGVHRSGIDAWAAGHGFGPTKRAGDPARKGGSPGELPEGGATTEQGEEAEHKGLSVNVHRLRRAALERRGKPVAHTRETYHDYLRTSRPALERGRTVMRQTLEEEVTKARAAQEIPVLTKAFLARATKDPEGAASDVGVDTQTLARLISGEQDTVLVGCTDPDNSPITGLGKPCGASFLDDCLRCENARALPRHLPVQVEAHRRLRYLQRDLDPGLWAHLHAESFARLSHLLGHYTSAERADACDRVTAAERALVDDLVNGRMDLR